MGTPSALPLRSSSAMSTPECENSWCGRARCMAARQAVVAIGSIPLSAGARCARMLATIPSAVSP